MKRTIGPVTGTIGAITAFITLIVWILGFFNLEIPEHIQDIIVVLAVFIAGWSVDPERTHKRAIEELFSDETEYDEYDI